MKKPFFVVIAASVAFAAPVFAQDAVADQHIVLKVETGSVLTSTGGEFESAATGQQLAVDEKLLVNAGSIARIVYDRGTTDTKDDCVIEFKKPGVYDVPSDCNGAVAWAGTGGSQLGNAAIIVGSAVVVGALLESMGSTAPIAPPVSLGGR